MRRAQTVPILALLLAACAAQPGATPASSAPSPTPADTDAPSATPEPSASPAAPSGFEGHPGEGLALVQFLDPDNPASQIFIVEEGGFLRQVTGLEGGIGATFPAWSPDRSQIAFGPPKVGFPGINGQVSVINADGSGERVLGVGEQQRWSPDGTRLLIHEKDDVTSDPFEIWIQEVATGEITELGPGFLAQWIDDNTIGFKRVVPRDDGAYADALYMQVLDGGEPVQLEPSRRPRRSGRRTGARCSSPTTDRSSSPTPMARIRATWPAASRRCGLRTARACCWRTITTRTPLRCWRS